MENSGLSTDNLDIALRMVGITLNRSIIDKIIGLVELLQTKGSDTSIKDVCELQEKWNKKDKNIKSYE